jgi:hypothetical protein
MGIEVVHHEHKLLGLGIMHIHSFANEVSPIHTRAVRSRL